MDNAERQRPLTVSQVLGAHAAAQMAQAQARDEAQVPPTEPAATGPAGFTVSWATQAMCIGWISPA
jgi:hypothetical protein